MAGTWMVLGALAALAGAGSVGGSSVGRSASRQKGQGSRASSLVTAYMDCIMLDERGNIQDIHTEQWKAVDHARESMDAPFPREILEVKNKSNVPIWFFARDGMATLIGESKVRLFVCDVAERALPVFQSRYPLEQRPRLSIEVARRYATGQATVRQLEEANRQAEVCVAALNEEIATARRAGASGYRRLAAKNAAIAACETSAKDGTILYSIDTITRNAVIARVNQIEEIGEDAKERIRNRERTWQIDHLYRYITGKAP